MRYFLFIPLAFLFTIPSVFSQKDVSFDMPTPEFANNHLKVKLKNEFQQVLRANQGNEKDILGIAEVDALNAKWGLKKADFIKAGGEIKSITFEFQHPIDVRQAVIEYTQTGKFDYVEPDFIGEGGGKEACAPDIMPNDANFVNQWGLRNTGTFPYLPAVAGNDIKAVDGWDMATGKSTVVVCILDSGAKLDHLDLTGRIWQNTKEIAGNGIDDDKNGKIDDTQGWDFVNQDNNPTDDHGHGTNVVGIVGANGNNSIGYSGVDWNCKLMIIKALDNLNKGLSSNIEAGIYYAVDNGAKVINISVVFTSNPTPVEAAINYAWNKGCIVIASMGNDNVGTTYYPAGNTNVIAVGSVNPNGKRSVPFTWSTTSGSNYGSHIDVVAPGNFIFGLKYNSNTDYNSYWSGTSQATPFVAGLAALVLARDPKLTPAQIKDVIQKGADDQTGDPTEDKAGFDNYFGWGRINVKKTLGLITTGLHDLKDESADFQVFPNPSKGIFTLSSPTILKGAQLDVLNTTGQIILSKNLQNLDNQLSMDIDISSQPTGIYFIHLKNSETFMTKKVVKN
jgi:thermitase